MKESKEQKYHYNFKPLFYTIFIVAAFIGTMIVCSHSNSKALILGIAILVLSFFAFLAGILSGSSSKKRRKKDSIEPDPISAPNIVKKFKFDSDKFDFFANNTTVDEKYVQELINAQSKTYVNFPIPYEGQTIKKISNLEFNQTTRSLKISFITTTYYRTVERYVQRNYEKYPIYSELKSKTKNSTKVYKLSNNNLEVLHDDFEHKDHHLYMSIICSLNSPSLVPTHFFEKALKNQCKFATQKCEEQISSVKESFDSFSQSCVLRQCFLQSKLSEFTRSIERHEQKLAKKSKKLSLLKAKSKTNIKLEQSCQKLDSTIGNLKELVENSSRELLSINTILRKEEASINNYIDETASRIEYIQQKTSLLIENFKPLYTDLNETTGFFPIKDLSGIDYKKIIGCYVIRNVEKNKYYAGQSKDILRRLKQHFKGTVPNNPIFAEDYYTTPEERRENLFEVKIIELQTKDELDRTEKELIEQYDCFTSGYNGTHGND